MIYKLPFLVPVLYILQQVLGEVTSTWQKMVFEKVEMNDAKISRAFRGGEPYTCKGLHNDHHGMCYDGSPAKNLDKPM